MLPVAFNCLMIMWFVVGPRQITPPFSMLQHEKGIENFPRGGNKYNEMNNIVKLLERVDKKCGGW